MERDFLCALGRKETGAEAAAVKEECRTESDCRAEGVVAAMQWQFPAKSGTATAFMSFTRTREESCKEFSISGFHPPPVGDAFDPIKKHASSPMTSHQRQEFGFDIPPVTVQLHGHRAQGLDHIAAARHPLGESRMVQPLSSRHPLPFNHANPMLRTQSLHNSGGLFKSPPFAISSGFGGSTVGAYGARNPRNQNSMQLTMFYNGTVNVFDNVSVDKAQELMLLASKASISSPPSSLVCKPDSPISAPAKINMPEVLPARQIVPQKPEPSVSHLVPASNPTSIMPQSVAPPRSISNCTTDLTGPKTVVQPPVVVHTSQPSSSQVSPLPTTSATVVMPRAVPQARKASLARFLEKRKERVTSVEPYPTPKTPLEASDTQGNASRTLSKSPFDIAPTSNNGETMSLRFGQTRNISFSNEACPPSTKLQI